MRFLVQFSQRHESFWLPELDSLLELNGLDPYGVYDHDRAWETVSRGHKASPFLVVELPSEQVVVAITERAILIRRVLELWGEGPSVEAAAEAVNAYPPERKEPYFAESLTWSVTVGSVGYSVKVEEKERLRLIFSFLPFRGRVKLRGPDHKFQVLGDYEAEDEWREGRLPEHVYFGREVAEGNRDLLAAFDLKKRPYLGPTSMDNELALVMGNMALSGKGKMCFDPFVGTGSILVACAYFGGFCVGTDIDVRVLKGKKGRNVYTNFDRYGLPRPELIRSDNALFERHFRVMEVYNCIVCDPPYGIRAGARKSGREGGEVRVVKPEDRFDHMPHTQPYPVEDVLFDLLEVAARTLVVGGRLCYLLASTWEFDIRRDLPRHPCLELSYHSVQGLTQLLCRRLITMTKISRYDVRRRDEYMAFRCGIGGPRPGPDAAGSCSTEGAAAERAGIIHDRGELPDGATGADNGGASAEKPFANLRERTFDMTRRGELTSANVWYARRKVNPAEFSAGSTRPESSDPASHCLRSAEGD